MLTVKVNDIQNTIGSKFATIQNYPKKNGELSNINFSLGCKVRTKGGKWTGDSTKNILVHKPAHPKNTNENYNGYRTLIKSSLVGCTLKANGQIYKIVA
jgi:hypothetical protein